MKADEEATEATEPPALADAIDARAYCGETTAFNEGSQLCEASYEGAIEQCKKARPGFEFTCTPLVASCDDDVTPEERHTEEEDLWNP